MSTFSLSDRIDVSLILLWRHRTRLVVSALIGALLGLLVGLVSTPRYKADVLLSPIKHGVGSGGLRQLSSQLGGLASLAGAALGGGLGDDESAPAMLRSHVLARQIIEQDDLVPVLFAKKWDATNKRWKARDAKDIPTLWDAERLFSRKVRRVTEDRRTGLITVTVVWSDPHLAEQWARKLVNTADRELRARAVNTAKANIDFLQEQLDSTSIVEVRQSIYRLLEDQLKELMLARGGPEYAFKVLDPAVEPEEPIGPSVPVLILGGALAALFLSAFLTLLLVPTSLRST